MAKKLPYLHPDRCRTVFERSAYKGAPTVLRRWQCPRKMIFLTGAATMLIVVLLVALAS